MRLHSLQYLRSIAALAVVFSHTSVSHEPFAEFLPEVGVFGVDIFFVISGFIMVWISKDDDRPGRFIVNRVRRVVPLYWFFTLLLAMALIWLPGTFRNTEFDIPSLLLSLGFIPHRSLAHVGELWPIVAPGWSLNYEMYFYVVFAIALLAPPAFRVLVISAFITTVFVIATLVGGDSVPVLFFNESIVLEFIFGMLLAIAFKRMPDLPSHTGIGLIVFSLCWLILDPPLPHALRFGIPALGIVAGCLYLRMPKNRIGLLLGDSSYALYLSHIFTLGVVRKVLPPLLDPLLGHSAFAAWTYAFLACVICIVGGILVHWIIDNWLLRRERLNMFRTRKPKEVSSPATPPSANKAS